MMAFMRSFIDIIGVEKITCTSLAMKLLAFFSSEMPNIIIQTICWRRKSQKYG